ncbi:ribonuclease H-like domain-containing protein [Mycolicibacterium palauense]|uniref:ribonuclease H-like domain-containing protein n=1 Tax=Mycolicibacterium palauense TaxID=2034511 RepID=UPI00114555EB|nr:ribonuclease H-like domain-containing protein [Mycolicibacterium palauense]
MSARIVTLDIERQAGLAEVWDFSPKFIRPEQFREPPRTICLAWKWLGDDAIHFASEWDDTHEGMIRKAHAVLDEADYVIGWNSAKFDIKHLRSHFLEYGILPPASHVDIDLMVNLKREFQFLYNRMAFIADTLGLDGKDKTPPGMWSDLRSEKRGVVTRARKAMEKYNRRDVELTEELYHLMLPWVKGINLNLFKPEGSMPVCPNCGSGNYRLKGTRPTATRLYQRIHCNDCGKWGQFTKSVQSSEVV